MIAVDINILIYAHREDSPFHELAFRRLAGLAKGRTAWAIPWPCIHEFLAIVTHPRRYLPPTPLARALDQLDAWLESPTLVLLTESAEHWPILQTLLVSGRVAGGQVHDARIAALCQEHGVTEFWSADRDFNRFPGLTAINPLIEVRRSPSGVP